MTEKDMNICIDIEVLFDYIQKNSNIEWNDICTLEYKYRKELENDEAYPLINYGTEDETTYQYWIERFLEAHQDLIKDKMIYVVH